MAKPEGVNQAAEVWFRPSAARNKEAILDVLSKRLPEKGLVLEVASGTGQHVVHFAAACPTLLWQPSDPDPALRQSIQQRTHAARLANVYAPLALDVHVRPWPIAHAAAIVCTNMIHIAPWSATPALFRGSHAVLAAGAALFLYGPFAQDDGTTAPGNLRFDRELRKTNPAWGVRTFNDVVNAAERAGLTLTERLEMPSNNYMLVFIR